jgi:prolipoprotein diacylglyceryltransferase
MAMYSVYRFGIEFLRKGYTAQPWILGLTQAQWVSIAIIIVSLIGIRRILSGDQNKR